MVPDKQNDRLEDTYPSNVRSKEEIQRSLQWPLQEKPNHFSFYFPDLPKLKIIDIKNETPSKGCFESAQFKCFHQLPNHSRQQITADSPNKKEAEYKC